MAPSKNYIYVVSRRVNDDDFDEIMPQLAFVNEDAAADQALAYAVRYGDEWGGFVTKIELKGGETSGSSKPKQQNAEKNQSGASAQVNNQRKEIPEGKPNALEGLKLLFTGTFDAMDRDTSKATAEKYGATVLNPNKISDTDYVILGTKAGAKKLDEIESHGLDTLNESEFFKLLENGVSAEKRQQMAAREAAKAEDPPAKKKQKQKK